MTRKKCGAFLKGASDPTRRGAFSSKGGALGSCGVATK